MKKIVIVIALMGCVVSNYAGSNLKLKLPKIGIEVPKFDFNRSFEINSTLPEINTDVEGVDRNLNIYFGPAFSSYGIGAMAYVDFEIPMIVDNLTLGPYVGFGVGYANNSKANKYYDKWGNPYYVGAYQSTPMFSFGAVAHYYFDWLIPNMKEQFDVFAKVKAGGNLGVSSYGIFTPDIDAQVGGRINFSGLSLYGTAGYGRSYVNIGLSFKL